MSNAAVNPFFGNTLDSTEEVWDKVCKTKPAEVPHDNFSFVHRLMWHVFVDSVHKCESSFSIDQVGGSSHGKERVSN